MNDDYFISKKAKLLFILFNTSGKLRRELLGVTYTTYITVASAKLWYDGTLAVLECPTTLNENECDSEAMLSAKLQLARVCEDEGVYHPEVISSAKSILRWIYKEEILTYHQSYLQTK